MGRRRLFALAVRFALWVPLPQGAARSITRAARAVEERAPGLATVALFMVAFEILWAGG